MAYKTLGNKNRNEPRRDCKLKDGGVTENQKYINIIITNQILL